MHRIDSNEGKTVKENEGKRLQKTSEELIVRYIETLRPLCGILSKPYKHQFSNLQPKDQKTNMVHLTTSLSLAAPLSLLTLVTAAPIATTITTSTSTQKLFSFAKWVDDLISHPGTALGPVKAWQAYLDTLNSTSVAVEAANDKAEKRWDAAVQCNGFAPGPAWVSFILSSSPKDLCQWKRDMKQKANRLESKGPRRCLVHQLPRSQGLYRMCGKLCLCFLHSWRSTDYWRF